VRDAGWAVVVPVKRLSVAKSRLRLDHLGLSREGVALAMAEDTVAAAGACSVVGVVLVVTDDPVAAGALARLGATVVPDDPAAGLNAAVRHGASVVATRPGRGVAALGADLPALRPGELAAALRAAARTPAGGFLADAAGTGTTLLAAPRGVPLRPRFGRGSAAAHAAAGLRRLDGDWPSLRRDVDTVEDLLAAGRLGMGPHTASLARARARGA
jgi:2-phospho-L-lactate guanylyltransferase